MEVKQIVHPITHQLEAVEISGHGWKQVIQAPNDLPSARRLYQAAGFLLLSGQGATSEDFREFGFDPIETAPAPVVEPVREPYDYEYDHYQD